MFKCKFGAKLFLVKVTGQSMVLFFLAEVADV